MDIDLFMKAFAGGVLIGIAASLLMLLNGRIAGISGIVGSFLKLQVNGLTWQATFIAGLLAAGILWPILFGGFTVDIVAAPGLLVVGGLLVGFGTRMGSGCTSGHGVCGIGRLSKRSIVATCTFILSGVVVVALLRTVWGVSI